MIIHLFNNYIFQDLNLYPYFYERPSYLPLVQLLVGNLVNWFDGLPFAFLGSFKHHVIVMYVKEGRIMLASNLIIVNILEKKRPCPKSF